MTEPVLNNRSDSIRQVATYVVGVLIDVLLLAGYVTFMVVWAQQLPTVVRGLVSLPFVLFVPGYIVLSVLFPRGEATVAYGQFSLLGSHLRWRDRMILSFGISVALLPVFGVVLALSGLGFAPETILYALSAFIIGGAVLSSVRRFSAPPDERFQIPIEQWREELETGTFGSESALDALLTIGVLLSVVAAMSMLGYAIVTPSASATYTDFSVLTENASGELVAAGYPTEFESGESQSVVLSISNNEGQQMTYEVVVELERIDTAARTVVERTELHRFQQSVDDQETWQGPVTIAPSMTGENLRVTFYLYETDAPDQPDTETAVGYLHFWIDVTDSETDQPT